MWSGERYYLIAVEQRMQESFEMCRDCCRTGCSSRKQRTHCSRTVLLGIEKEKNDLAGFFCSTRHTSQGAALLSLWHFALNFY